MGSPASRIHHEVVGLRTRGFPVHGCLTAGIHFEGRPGLHEPQDNMLILAPRGLGQLLIAVGSALSGWCEYFTVIFLHGINPSLPLPRGSVDGRYMAGM